MSGTTVEPLRLRRRPALDGLRAIAVIAVLLYHDNPRERLPGGFLGVDIFFVLSGFLITTILLTADAQRGSAVSADFWIRRARRLIPAFLLMVLLISAITLFSGDVFDAHALRSQGLASIFYVYNWYVVARTVVVTTMFSHTWSLSIEEQWYLVWPFLVAALLAVVRRSWRLLSAAIIVLTCASAAWMGYAAHHISRSRAFFGTDTRAWELLAGAALAVLLPHMPLTSNRARRVTEVAGFAGLAAIAWTILHYRQTDLGLYPTGRVILVVATGAVIVASVPRDVRVLGHVLGWKPLVGVGLISYGLYLFHAPIYWVLSPERTHADGMALLVLRLAVVTAFAWLSYRFLEMPIRRGGWPRVPARVLFPAGVAVVTGVFVFATFHPAEPDTGRAELRGFRTLAAATPKGTVRVLAVGDDTAAQLVRGLQPPVRLEGIRGVVASAGACGLVDGQPMAGTTPLAEPTCRPWPDVYREGRDGYDPAVTVMAAGSADLVDRRIGGRIVRAGTPELTRRLRAELERAHRILTAGGTPMILLTVPCADPDADFPPTWAAVRRDPARITWVNSVWRAFAAAHPRDVRLADLDTVLCPRLGPDAAARAAQLRPDGVTLSGPGIGAVWLWLAPMAKELAHR